MKIRRMILLSMAIGVFVLMVAGQSLSIIEESSSSARGQEPVPATKNVRRCRELGMLARTQYDELVAGRKQLWDIVESAQKRIDEIHKAEPVDREQSGRMHFVMLFATIQANKQSEYVSSSLGLAGDVAKAEEASIKTRQEIPDAIIQSLEQASRDLDARIKGVAALAKEMKDAIAHPERPFPRPTK
jgi:flagellar basal body-associated protein FliL